MMTPERYSTTAARPSSAPKAGEDGATEAFGFPPMEFRSGVEFSVGVVAHALTPGNSLARQTSGLGEHSDRLACDHPGRSGHGRSPRPGAIR